MIEVSVLSMDRIILTPKNEKRGGKKIVLC